MNFLLWVSVAARGLMVCIEAYVLRGTACSWRSRERLSGARSVTPMRRANEITSISRRDAHPSFSCGKPPRLEDYFTDEAIVREVVKKRICLARCRHNDAFLEGVGVVAPTRVPTELDELLPPRSQCVRLTRKERARVGGSRVRSVELRTTALRGLRCRARRQWQELLRNFIDAVRLDALRLDGQPIAPDRIIARRKPNGLYRPLSHFSLRDSVVEGLTARYLRDLFDPLFSSQSFAFRGRNAGRHLDHHDGARAVVDYRLARPGIPLWVAEVDLCAFFDCLGHDVARAAVERMTAKLRAKGSDVDPRALAILDRYLAGYTFQSVAVPLAQAWFAAKDPNGKLAWPHEQLAALWPELATERIGVPQGGSLSLLLANAVLDGADRAVQDTCLEEPLLYGRVLDDVIIIHTSEHVVRGAFERYLGAIAALKLPHHQPGPQRRYDHRFWGSKTKAPYCWIDSKTSGSSPWVGFVGYQFRFDGLMKIRPSSVEREKAKVASLCRLVLQAAARGGTHLSRNETLSRVTGRLVAGAVGRSGGGRVPQGAFCWTAGFRQMQGSAHSTSQLADLDRHRERELGRLRKRLPNIVVVGRTGPRRRRRPRYWGHPFSYVGQFTRGRSD